MTHLPENVNTCWQNCTQRIRDDIVGARAITVSINDFENKCYLKKYSIQRY